jgi:ATPase family protein associated with various cellular activities (AAA)/winged helix domain-containing protein
MSESPLGNGSTWRLGDVSRRMNVEVGLLAGRLAQLLERLPSAGSLGEAEGTAFLWQFFESNTGGRPTLEHREGSAVGRVSGLSHPIDLLADALGLSPFEVDLLLLTGLPEEHEGVSGVMRALNPRGEARPTVGLAAQLFAADLGDRDHIREVLETGPLVRSGAIALTAEVPFFERSLRPADQLWPALHGVDAWPASIRRRLGPATLDGLDGWFGAPDVALAAQALKRPQPLTILINAQSEEISLERAAAVAAHAGVTFVRAYYESPASQVEQLIALHAIVRGAVPIICLPAGGGEGAPHNFLLDHPGPVVLCARTGSGIFHGLRPMLTLDVEPLSPSERRTMWAAILPELASQAPLLATRHAIEPATAAEAALDVRATQLLSERATRVDDISRSLQARARLTLAAGVKLMRPVATWRDLVLAPDRTEQLREALGRLLFQSRVLDDWGFLEGRPGARGVRMLFAGPPGTGKTLAAEVMAHALGAHLLVVDISRVVSKWIGETEKNLAEVFDTAERVQAVLLFDEADALFGKRTEVSDAHDRYANLETAYLLARLERFEGLAILSTNLRQNIDTAFIRRLEFVVEFDEPGTAQREELWRCHLPPNAPIAPDVRLSTLASLYPVVGAVIRNAAVAAAFRAASDDTAIGLSHFVHAVRREYQKAGRPFPGAPAQMS